jgi:hypothetical protein
MESGGSDKLQASIENLSPEEHRRIVQWFRLREQRRWDEQMDANSAAGKLDFFFDEAESEGPPSRVTVWIGTNADHDRLVASQVRWVSALR